MDTGKYLSPERSDITVNPVTITIIVAYAVQNSQHYQ